VRAIELKSQTIFVTGCPQNENAKFEPVALQIALKTVEN